MKRVIIAATLALGFVLTACGGGGDKARMVKACIGGGESEALCSCLADGLEKNLDAETFRALARASGDEAADKVLENLSADKQMQAFGALMSAGMACAASVG
jgi:hypothetical protein